MWALLTPQPLDYPLYPFKMTFDPPLLHPNSMCFCHPLFSLAA